MSNQKRNQARPTITVNFFRRDGKEETFRLLVPRIGLDLQCDAAADESEEGVLIASMLSRLEPAACAWHLTTRFSELLGQGLQQRSSRLWDAAWCLHTMSHVAESDLYDATELRSVFDLDLDETQPVAVRVVGVPAPGDARALILDLCDADVLTVQREVEIDLFQLLHGPAK